MWKTLYRATRALHLYAGIFISPFILLYAISVFFLVHAWLPRAIPNPSGPRIVSDLTLPQLDQLSGRERIDALQPVLHHMGVHGEVGWVQHDVKENRLVIPVTVPGRVTTVTIDTLARKASVTDRTTGLADALAVLHKSPGPHLVGMRMNWFPMRVWFWLADATVSLVLFLTVSGILLWYALRNERRIGFALLVAGALSFFSMVYAIAH